MNTYTVTLQGRDEVADRTMAFHFDKPEGFAYKPGQAVDLALPQQSGAEPQVHTFSLVSAPYQNELAIATRMRDSAYKRALQALADGEQLTLQGPSGSLTLSEKKIRPAVLLAGGIGITPFLSMLRQATHDASPRPLALLYSNRRPEDAAFLHELQQLAQRNPHLRLIATMTQMEQSRQPWDGDTGPIDAAKVRRAAEGYDKPVYYLAGPPGLVDFLRDLLEDAGVDEDDMRSEEFFGY